MEKWGTEVEMRDRRRNDRQRDIGVDKRRRGRETLDRKTEG